MKTDNENTGMNSDDENIGKEVTGRKVGRSRFGGYRK